MSEFTYLDPIGRSRISESSVKEPAHRRAVARCKVRMLEDTANSIATNSITKGDVLQQQELQVYNLRNKRRTLFLYVIHCWCKVFLLTSALKKILLK